MEEGGGAVRIPLTECRRLRGVERAGGGRPGGTQGAPKGGEVAWEGVGEKTDAVGAVVGWSLVELAIAAAAVPQQVPTVPHGTSATLQLLAPLSRD